MRPKRAFSDSPAECWLLRHAPTGGEFVVGRGMRTPTLVLARPCIYTAVMRFAGVSVENYRSFVDHTNIELRPLTLLFGYNSAGKSAALRVLPIVAASTGPNQSVPLALDSEAARGASFKDLLSRQSSSPTLNLGLSFSDQNASNLYVRLDIRDLTDRQTQIVERIEIRESPDSAIKSVEALWDTHLSEPSAGTQRYEFRLGARRSGRLQWMSPASCSIRLKNSHLVPS